MRRPDFVSNWRHFGDVQASPIPFPTWTRGREERRAWAKRWGIVGDEAWAWGFVGQGGAVRALRTQGRGLS